MKSDLRYVDFMVSCCDALEVDIEDVIATDKKVRYVVEVRQFLSWAFRNRWRLSFSHIGRLMNRDHTTVMSSVRKVQCAINARKPWALQLEATCNTYLRGGLEVESALESLEALQA